MNKAYGTFNFKPDLFQHKSRPSVLPAVKVCGLSSCRRSIVSCQTAWSSPQWQTLLILSTLRRAINSAVRWGEKTTMFMKVSFYCKQTSVVLTAKSWTQKLVDLDFLLMSLHRRGCTNLERMMTCISTLYTQMIQTLSEPRWMPSRLAM